MTFPFRRGLLAAALLLSPATAFAHAHLRSSEPPADGVVATAPTKVEITFSEAVEPKFSSIVVTDGSGAVVDRKDVHVPGSDAHHLAVSLGTLAPGEYHVRWQATAVDTHKTEGAFSFRVAP